MDVVGCSGTRPAEALLWLAGHARGTMPGYCNHQRAADSVVHAFFAHGCSDSVAAQLELCPWQRHVSAAARPPAVVATPDECSEYANDMPGFPLPCVDKVRLLTCTSNTRHGDTRNALANKGLHVVLEGGRDEALLVRAIGQHARVAASEA